MKGPDEGGYLLIERVFTHRMYTIGVELNALRSYFPQAVVVVHPCVEDHLYV